MPKTFSILTVVLAIVPLTVAAMTGGIGNLESSGAEIPWIEIIGVLLISIMALAVIVGTEHARRARRARTSFPGEPLPVVESDILDEAVVSRFEQDLPGHALASLFEGFERDSRNRVERMIAAAEKAALQSLEREAGTLSASARTYGAAALAEMSGRLAAACHDGRFIHSSGQIAALRQTAERTFEAFRIRSASSGRTVIPRMEAVD